MHENLLLLLFSHRQTYLNKLTGSFLKNLNTNFFPHSQLLTKTIIYLNTLKKSNTIFQVSRPNTHTEH
jgi:hypothetical protein